MQKCLTLRKGLMMNNILRIMKNYELTNCKKDLTYSKNCSCFSSPDFSELSHQEIFSLANDYYSQKKKKQLVYML